MRIILAVMMAEFVSDGKSYMKPRDCWCNIIMVDKTNNTKYHMKILFGDFDDKVGMENIFSNQQLGMIVYMKSVIIITIK
jgi:hypothetical protein